MGRYRWQHPAPTRSNNRAGVVPRCDYASVLLPIARSAYAHEVALWVSGGDQTAFTSALAMHETDSWTGRHTGGVDESVAAFDEHERWIALHLARQGHNVIALPTRHLAGLRSPDAAVSGLLVEFKTYTGRNPRQLLCRVGKALPQADRVVVGVDAPWDSEILRSVFRAATALAHRRGMRAVMFIGDGFQLEWGDWNGLLTSSATTQHPSAPTAGIDVGITEQHTNCRPPKRYTHHTRRLRPCPTPAGNHGP